MRNWSEANSKQTQSTGENKKKKYEEDGKKLKAYKTPATHKRSDKSTRREREWKKFTTNLLLLGNVFWWKPLFARNQMMEREREINSPNTKPKQKQTKTRKTNKRTNEESNHLGRTSVLYRL